jgi:tRNA-dihydrouridine synthase B
MIDFSNPVYALAPLAGYTDLPFREVVKEFGADFTVSEMINANALTFRNEKTLKMTTKAKNESPYAVQIAAQNATVAKSAIEVLNEVDYIDGIDLNVGCPVKKAIKSGYGGNLLNEAKNLSEIIKAIKSTHNKKYFSVKMRIGFEDKNGVDMAKLIEESGADFITVHGRTVKQLYTGKADYEMIAKIKEAVSVPVIANGDIDSFEKAKYVFDYTKCDGVMIGRGAIGRPWIFMEMKEGKELSNERKKEIILAHFSSIIDWYGERGVTLFRKHLHTYSKGYDGASEFRQNVNKIENSSELEKLLREFF